jgi:hypothetical protein
MQEQQPVQKRIDSIKVLSFFPETWANQQELDRFSRHGKNRRCAINFSSTGGGKK